MDKEKKEEGMNISPFELRQVWLQFALKAMEISPMAFEQKTGRFRPREVRDVANLAIQEYVKRWGRQQSQEILRINCPVCGVCSGPLKTPQD